MESPRWVVPEPSAVFQAHTPDGTAITVRRHGDPNGPRLVLSHGNGLSIDSYFPFWSLLTDRFDLFIHDLRNHGWNPVGDRRMHNVPTFISDGACVAREIDRRFGARPRIGLFHSLSALTALHQADDDGFAALILFDPPISPPGGLPQDLQHIGRRLGMRARRRRDRFNSPEEFSTCLSQTGVFDRVHPGVRDLVARATLRRSDARAATHVTSFAVHASTKPKSANICSVGR